MTLPPSLLSALPAEELPALSSVIRHGRSLLSRTRRALVEGRRFFNGYGPTETTIGATFHEFTDSGDEAFNRHALRQHEGLPARRASPPHPRGGDG